MLINDEYYSCIGQWNMASTNAEQKCGFVNVESSFRVIVFCKTAVQE